MRTFGIFFNHNKQPVFLFDEVREALNEAAPKRAIVGEILRGYGTILTAPLPPHVVEAVTAAAPRDEESETGEDETQVEDEDRPPVNHIERAQRILEDAGWERNDNDIYVLDRDDELTTLSLTLSTVSTPELLQAAERVAASWRDMGAQVELKVFEPSDLTQSVIRPRRYDALLFGMVVGHELDLYAFWHSSQRNDPGLNIAQLADIEADAWLEKMRTEHDAEARAELYQAFLERVEEEVAAVFLYAPDFIYVVNDRIHNVTVHPISERCERFDTIHTWHIQTDHVWPFVDRLLD
jgi:peptide/nickel transport system substrate-binding protein